MYESLVLVLIFNGNEFLLTLQFFNYAREDMKLRENLQSNDTASDLKILRNKNKRNGNVRSTIVYFTLHEGIRM